MCGGGGWKGVVVLCDVYRFGSIVVVVVVRCAVVVVEYSAVCSAVQCNSIIVLIIR